MSVDLSACLKEAVAIAKHAGEMVLESVKNRNTDFKVYEKGNVDFVTDTDKAVEKYIFSKLKELYPEHCFIGIIVL